MMHAAKLADSPRLQRVLEVLSDGREHSTLDISQQARVCAVNSCIAELRANGKSISCRQVVEPLFGRVWVYRLHPGGECA